MKCKPARWLSLLVFLFVFLAACTSAPPPTAAPTASPEPQELNIYNWDTYIDPALLSDFEKKFGVKINYDIYDGNEQLLDQVKANPNAYDLIVPSDYMVSLMRREGLLSPLNKENLPNFKNIDPLFINPALDPGNRYCVPYQWGTTAIGYNLKATGREIASWDDVFDPAYAGRVALLDAARETLGVILLYLGYSPNSLNSVEIAAARDFLKDRTAHIATYHGDDGQELLADGRVDIVLEYSGDIFQVMEDHPDLRYTIPVEGAILWSDNMCIPAGAPHQELAEEFINYILEPEVGAALSNFTRYSTPNLAAFPLVNEADRHNPSLYPSAEVRNTLFYLVDVGPDATQLYDKAWADVLAAHRP